MSDAYNVMKVKTDLKKNIITFQKLFMINIIKEIDTYHNVAIRKKHTARLGSHIVFRMVVK